MFTKLLKTYTLSDHQPYSRTLQVSPEKPVAIKQPKLTLNKANRDELNVSIKNFLLTLFATVMSVFLESNGMNESVKRLIQTSSNLPCIETH